VSATATVNEWQPTVARLAEDNWRER